MGMMAFIRGGWFFSGAARRSSRVSFRSLGIARGRRQKSRLTTELLENRRVLASAAPADPTSTALNDNYISLAEDTAGVRLTIPLGGSGHGAGDIVSVYVNGNATPGSGVLVGQSAALTGKESSVAITLASGALGTAGNEGKINTLSSEIIDLTGSSPTGTSFRSPGTKFTLDTVAPSITAFAQGTGGSLLNKVGSVISLEATADETVNGSISVTLDTGAVVKLSAAAGGSTKLTGSYTVAAKQNSNDLAVVSFTTGGLKDLAGNTVNAGASATGSIGGSSPIVVDTTAPTVASVALPTAGTYYVTATPQRLILTVNFSEPVTLPTTAFVRGFIGPNGNANAFATPADFLFSQSLNNGASYEFVYALQKPAAPAPALPPDIDGITFDTTVWDTATPGVGAVISDASGNVLSPTTNALQTALTPNPTAINIGPSTTVAKVIFDAISPSPRVDPVQVITVTFKDSTDAGAAVPFGAGLGSLALTEDFQLRRNGVLVDLTTPDSNGKVPEFTYVLNPADPFYAARFQIRNIAHLTSLPGAYRLTFSDIGIGPSAELAWAVTYATPGELTATVEAQPIPTGGATFVRTTPVDSIKVVFTTTNGTGTTVPVSVKNVDTAAAGSAIKQFLLYKDETLVPLPATARVTGSGSTYYLTGIASVTQATGSYDVVVVPEEVTNSLGAAVRIMTLSDTPLIAATGTSWQYVNTSITSATVTSPSGATGIVREHGAIDLTVSFSSPVVVDPNLPAPSIDVYLSTYGNGPAKATYLAGSGTKDLVFRYMVKTGDLSPAGVAFGSSIALNGGTVLDVAGKQPLLSFRQPAAPGVVVDTVAPQAVAFVLPTDGVYSPGASLLFGVDFDEAMQVTGSPKLTFTFGSVARKATFDHVDASTVYFRYDVLPADLGAVGVTATGVSLNGGAIADLAGNLAVLTGLAPATTGLVTVDASAPSIVSIDVSAPATPNSVGPSTVTFTLSEPSPDFTGAGITATNATISGERPTESVSISFTKLEFKLAPYARFEGYSTITVPAGTYHDVAGNPNLEQQFQVAIDSLAPTVTLAALSSAVTTASNSTPISAAFSEPLAALPVISVSDPSLGSVGAWNAAGTAATFTAAANKEGSVTLWIADKSYTDVAGNPGSGAAPITIAIDTLAPAVTNVSSTTANGAYKAGDRVTILVTFREPVTVTGGTPTLRLNAGANAVATWTGAGNGTTSLTFEYVVEAGDATSGKLDVADTAALALGGSTIRDAAGNDAVLTLPAAGAVGSISRVKNIVIDTQAPFVVAPLAIAPAIANAAGGAVVTLTLSEASADFAAVVPTVANGSLSGFVKLLTPANTYQATLTPTAGFEGLATITIPSGTFHDGAGNTNALQQFQVPIDTKRPTVALAAPSATINVLAPTSALTAAFSETPAALPTLAITQSSPGLGTLGGLSGTNPYAATFAAAPGKEGSVTIWIAAGAYADAAGNPGEAATPVTILVDTLAPTITNVSSTTVNGSYKAGTTVMISVRFREAVTVDGGEPTLRLNVGSNAVATYTGGSGTRVLSFEYLVADGHNSADLDYADASSLALEGATIRDAAGNDAVLTLPSPGSAGSLGANKDIVIDTLAPTLAIVATPTTLTGTQTAVVRFTAAGGVAAGALQGLSLPAGSVLGGTLTPLAVTATAGGQEYLATFTPTLDSATPGSVSVPAAWFTDRAGNGNLPSTQPASIVHSATVRSVATTVASGIYSAAAAPLIVTVTFDERVFVNGAEPRLALNVGAGRFASYVSGSGTNELTFRYTIQAGDNTGDFDYASSAALLGDLRNNAGTSATATLPAPGTIGSLSQQRDIVVDTIAPVVTAIKTRSTPNGTYGSGAKVRLQVEFSEPVVVSGTPTLRLNSGTGAVATWNGVGSGTSTLVFVYTVRSGEKITTLDSAGINSLLGTIRDLAGNASTAAVPFGNQPGSLATTASIAIDAVAPAIVAIDTATPAGSYRAGDTIWLRVRFTKNVTVVGSPLLLLNAAANRAASYASGSGTSTLLFQYTVQPGDATVALDYASSSALMLNGGSLKDLAGNVASVSLPVPGTAGSLSAATTLRIDTAAPGVVSVVSGSAAGTYGIGQTVRFSVVMSEPVTVSGGAPAVWLNTTPQRAATYEGPIGTPTTSLAFRYDIQPGDVASRLDAVTIAPGTAQILDAARNAAILSLPVSGTPASLSGSVGLSIDAVVRAVGAGLASSLDAAPTYSAAVTRVAITFNTPVTGVSLAAMQLFYEGRSVSLNGASLTGSGSSYVLTLPAAITSLKGTYRLRIGGGALGITAVGGGGSSPASNLYWKRA